MPCYGLFYTKHRTFLGRDLLDEELETEKLRGKSNAFHSLTGLFLCTEGPRNPHPQPTWTGYDSDAKSQLLYLKGSLHDDLLEGAVIAIQAGLSLGHRLIQVTFFLFMSTKFIAGIFLIATF